MGQVLKLYVQRAGAFEGTVSRGGIPTIESGRNENRRPESNTGGSQSGDIPREKGIPEAVAAVAAIGDAADRERRCDTGKKRRRWEKTAGETTRRIGLEIQL